MTRYFVLGTDLKEYGPVSLEDLQKWVREGRANAQTKVRAEGGGDWVPLSDVPEFVSAYKTGSPPPFSAAPPQAAVGKTSALAITSLVLGILGVVSCGATALIGLILGIMAIVRISNSQGRLEGKGLAIAGTVVSGFFLLLVPVFAAMLLPALAAAKQKALLINCLNNEKQLALGLRIYSTDNHNHLPAATNWCDAVKASVGSEKTFRCPVNGATNRCDYAFNAKLDGVDLTQVNPKTVLLFESDAGWNAQGGTEILSARHGSHGRPVAVVAFADGHVEVVPEARLNNLRWDP
jgi:prepilin-type processing-associated H-X9-DG protein